MHMMLPSSPWPEEDNVGIEYASAVSSIKSGSFVTLTVMGKYAPSALVLVPKPLPLGIDNVVKEGAGEKVYREARVRINHMRIVDRRMLASRPRSLIGEA